MRQGLPFHLTLTRLPFLSVPVDSILSSFQAWPISQIAISIQMFCFPA
jgi:hypothetical protein